MTSGAFLLLALAFLAAIVALSLALKFRGLVSVHQLGQIEGSLPRLKRVVVVADHVEPPSDELRLAVENNFERGVKYEFLVSKSKAEVEIHSYVEIFLAIARIVQARLNEPRSIAEFVEINKLAYDWSDFPYIFYEIGSPEIGGPSLWAAYEGTDRQNGLADFYAEVPAKDARKLAQAVLAGAPEPIFLDATDIVDPKKVTSIEVAKRNRADQSG